MSDAISLPAHARVVLIGGGNQANRAIYPCIAAAGIFEVLATVDLEEAKARATAGRTGAPRTYTDVGTALDETKPDGAFVIGPPAMQGSVAAQVLERGVPVFTEKPSAPTVAGARHLLDLAAQRGTWGMTGFMKCFNDAYRAARACLGRPEFGRPLFLEKHFYAQNPHRREGQSDADLLWQVLIMQGTRHWTWRASSWARSGGRGARRCSAQEARAPSPRNWSSPRAPSARCRSTRWRDPATRATC